jgi:hypothetical protein
MKKVLFAAALAAFIVPGSLSADTGATDSAAVESGSAASHREFQGDDLPGVLRMLARDAKVTLVVDDRISGTITMRLEDKTPLEAIKIIAFAKGLDLTQADGVYYIRSKDQSTSADIGPANPPPPIDPPTQTSSSNTVSSLADMLTPEMLGMMSKYYDSTLDYLDRPETARRLAKAKKELYDALIAEGFTKDQAFRLILTNEEIDPPSAK